MSARDVSPFVGWHCTGVFGHRKMQCSEPCAWCRDEAAKNEAALTAAGYAVEQGWQDISTAPRDGTAILLHVDWERLSLVGYWNGTAWAVKWDGCALGGGFEPVTHWRPLPAPPAGEVK